MNKKISNLIFSLIVGLMLGSVTLIAEDVSQEEPKVESSEDEEGSFADPNITLKPQINEMTGATGRGVMTCPSCPSSKEKTSKIEKNKK